MITSVKHVTADGEFWVIPNTALLAPAYYPNIWETKYKLLCKFGTLHREDGPAVILIDRKIWCVNGKRHREDGPAVELDSGVKEWYQSGKRHREDGPAVEHPGGGYEWRLNGKLHRTDGGPAFVTPSGTIKWWIQNGVRHRTDGPAVINNSGEQWFLNGKRHRLDGPAVYRTDGTHEEWFSNGKRHCTTGPAYNGKYYLHGKRMSHIGWQTEVRIIQTPHKMTLKQVEEALGYAVEIIG